MPQEPLERSSTIAPGNNPDIGSIILMILAVTVAGLSLIAFYRNRVVVSSSQIQEQNTNEPAQESSPTVQNWQTYASQNDEFSINYPDNVNVAEAQNGFVLFSEKGPTQTDDTELFDGISLRIGILRLNNRTLEQAAQEDGEEIEEVGRITREVESVTINGINGYSYSAETLGTFTKYFLPVGNTAYLEITDSTVDPTNQGYRETVDRMLGSLVIDSQD